MKKMQTKIKECSKKENAISSVVGGCRGTSGKQLIRIRFSASCPYLAGVHHLLFASAPSFPTVPIDVYMQLKEQRLAKWQLLELTDDARLVSIAFMQLSLINHPWTENGTYWAP